MADNVKALGGTQRAVLLRARGSSSGIAIVLHGREGNAERLAARRLVARGLLLPPVRFGGRWGGRGVARHVYAYGLTQAGREVEL